MKNTARTQDKSSKANNTNAGAFAVPLAVPLAVHLAPPKSTAQAATETERRMLLVRLSDAADKIRKETELIQRTSFGDPTGRLLRILAETVEEQRLSFGAVRGAKK
ncbi:hypothetical protein BH10BDE1_BH10BDE1_31970 [soil metagenome]